MSNHVSARLEKVFVVLLMLSFGLPLGIGAWLQFSHNQSPATAWLRNATLSGTEKKKQPVVFKYTKVISAKWQTAYARDYDIAFPGRELLIRLANEFYLRVFHTSPVGVLVGPQLSLIESTYLQEYCLVRDDKDALRPMVEDIRRLQDFCDARGTVFSVLITPSKASINPENNPGGWQRRFRPGPRYYDHFVSLLQEKGVHFVDGHRITAELKTSSGLPVFSTGGAHWTDPAVLATLNSLLTFFASKGLDVEPIRDLRPELVYDHRNGDSDLADLLNIVFPLRFPAPVVTVKPTDRPVPYRPNCVFIGGSFLWKILRTLDDSRQFSETETYFYYRESKSNHVDGIDREIVGAAPPINLENDVFAADSLVLEFNEEKLTQPNHAIAFLHDALAALPDPKLAKGPFHYENPLAYRWDKTISLAGNCGAADAARLKGFELPNGIGAYTVGPVASVRFPIPPPAVEDLVLEMNVIASMVSEKFPRQGVDVYANGHRIAQWEWRDKSSTRREVTIPKEFLDGGEVAVEFRLERPVSPAEIGSGKDERKLGIRVSSLRIHTAQNITASSPVLRPGGLPAYRWGDIVSFIEYNRTHALPEMQGFSPPGDAGVFTEGEVASWRFSVTPPKEDVELGVKTLAARTGKGQPVLSADVYVNGKRVGDWKWKDAASTERKILIPKGVIDSNEMLVELRFDHPLSPLEMGLGDDVRKLGVCISEMRFDSPPIVPVVIPDLSPPSCQWGDVISFVSSKEAKKLPTVKGWSPPGDAGAYTDGEVASLRFLVPPPKDDAELTLKTIGARTGKGQPVLSADVFVNGKRVGAWKWNDPAAAERKVLIPKDLASTGELLVELRFDHPLSLAEMGLGGDPRKLGVCVSEMRLTTPPAVVPAAGPVPVSGPLVYQMGEAISFAATKEAAAKMPVMKGWSPPGEAGAYTDGDVASLRFSVPPPQKNVDLVADTVGAITGKGQAKVTANVYVNGKRVGVWTWKDAMPSKRSVAIPKNLIAKGDVLLELRFDHLLSAAQMKPGGDPRKLGICVTTIQLSPAKK